VSRGIARRGCVGAIALAVCAVPSCGPKNFANQNDELRREREDLRTRIADLERELAEAQAKLALAVQPGTTGPDGRFDAAEVALATPVCATLEIDRLSGLHDSDGDGSPDVLIVRVRTLDGRGRFTQVVGSMAVRAELVRTDAPGEQIGTVTLGPVAVREAYRSGFGGSWYTAEVPVAMSGARAGDRVLIAVRLERVDGPAVDNVRVLDGIWDRWVADKKNP